MPRLNALRDRLEGPKSRSRRWKQPPNLKRLPYRHLPVLPRGSAPRRHPPDDRRPAAGLHPGIGAAVAGPGRPGGQTCLTDAVWAEDWQVLARAVSPDWAFAPRGPVFSLYAMALDAARAGRHPDRAGGACRAASAIGGAGRAFPQTAPLSTAITAWANAGCAQIARPRGPRPCRCWQTSPDHRSRGRRPSRRGRRSPRHSGRRHALMASTISIPAVTSPTMVYWPSKTRRRKT